MASNEVEVRPGQVWKDLDKRMSRVVKVIEVRDGKAIVRSGWDGDGRKATISISRMRPVVGGWRLIPEE